MHIFGKGFNFEIMMKLNKNRINLVNEAFYFCNPVNFNFQCFISLPFTNKFRNDKAENLFQLNKNQHLEKMLVFFCDNFKKHIINPSQEIIVALPNLTSLKIQRKIT